MRSKTNRMEKAVSGLHHAKLLLVLNRLNRKARNSMSTPYRRYARFVSQSLLPAAALGVFFLAPSAALGAQSVPPALESPAAQPPQTGPPGEKLVGMPQVHD